MTEQGSYRDGYVTAQLHGQAADLHYSSFMGDTGPGEFGTTIRSAREAKGWTQDDLAKESGTSRPTINRYEQGKTQTPEPDKARAIFKALDLDPRRIPVLLGYVTAREMGLPAELPRVLSAPIEEVVRILQNPDVPDAVKREWVEYLRFRSPRAAGPERRAG